MCAFEGNRELPRSLTCATHQHQVTELDANLPTYAFINAFVLLFVWMCVRVSAVRLISSLVFGPSKRVFRALFIAWSSACVRSRSRGKEPNRGNSLGAGAPKLDVRTRFRASLLLRTRNTEPESKDKTAEKCAKCVQTWHSRVRIVGRSESAPMSRQIMFAVADDSFVKCLLRWTHDNDHRYGLYTLFLWLRTHS